MLANKFPFLLSPIFVNTSSVLQAAGYMSLQKPAAAEERQLYCGIAKAQPSLRQSNPANSGPKANLRYKAPTSALKFIGGIHLQHFTVWPPLRPRRCSEAYPEGDDGPETPSMPCRVGT